MASPMLANVRINSIRGISTKIHPSRNWYRISRPFSSAITDGRKHVRQSCIPSAVGLSSTRNYFWSSSKPLTTETPVSDAPATVDTAAPPEVAAVSPSPPVEPSETVLASNSADDLTEAPIEIPPLEIGDFADLGLASWWTPAGWIRRSLELLHVSTGLPWFYTIVVGTLAWRLLSLPATIKAAEAGAKMRAIAPQAEAARLELDRVNRANEGPAAKMRALQGVQKVYADGGINPLAGLWGLIVVPIQLGLFFGVKKMCDFPVIQLSQSGFPWYPDLTATDPYYVMPILSALLLQYSIKAGVRSGDIDVSNRNMAKGLAILTHLTWFSPFVLMNLPVGTLVQICTNAAFSVGWGAAIRQPTLRARIGLSPRSPNAGPGRLPTLREIWQDYKVQLAQAQETAKQAREASLKAPARRLDTKPPKKSKRTAL